MHLWHIHAPGLAGKRMGPIATTANKVDYSTRIRTRPTQLYGYRNAAPAERIISFFQSLLSVLEFLCTIASNDVEITIVSWRQPQNAACSQPHYTYLYTQQMFMLRDDNHSWKTDALIVNRWAQTIIVDAPQNLVTVVCGMVWI